MYNNKRAKIHLKLRQFRNENELMIAIERMYEKYQENIGKALMLP